MIWEYALVPQRNEVDLTPTDDIIPPLARVCKQLNSEAKGIWFSRNKFCLPIHDFDCTTLFRFTRLKTMNCPPTWLPGQGIDFVCRFSHDPSSSAIQRRRRNFLSLLEGMWKGIYVLKKDFYDTISLIANRHLRTNGVLFQAQQCFDQGLQWSQVKDVLETAIKIAAVCGERIFQ